MTLDSIQTLHFLWKFLLTVFLLRLVGEIFNGECSDDDAKCDLNSPDEKMPFGGISGTSEFGFGRFLFIPFSPVESSSRSSLFLESDSELSSLTIFLEGNSTLILLGLKKKH